MCKHPWHDTKPDGDVPQPPYPYFYRTALQKEKTRWHKLLIRIERELLPNLRRWKYMYKSAHPSLVKENARLRRENAELREALESIAANSCCGPCQEAALVARAALRSRGGR